MLSRTVKITCTDCCRSFMWDLEEGPAHKSRCPYCQGEKEIAPKPKGKKKKKKKTRKRMLTNEERYPANEDCEKPTYPQEWMLDFHCRSLNEYHMSPHLRVRDKGAAYRAFEKLGISKVRRTNRKVKVTVVSCRQRLADTQSLYGGSSKGLLDVLVRMGWVHDDTEEWCDFSISQEKVLKKDLEAGKERGTRVEIRAVKKPRKKKE